MYLNSDICQGTYERYKLTEKSETTDLLKIEVSLKEEFSREEFSKFLLEKIQLKNNKDNSVTFPFREYFRRLFNKYGESWKDVIQHPVDINSSDFLT